MTESQFQQKLLARLRSHAMLKDAVIFKHADRWSAGIPDFSISIGTKTLWCEIKIVPNVPTKLQRFFLTKIGSGALLVQAHRDGKSAMIGYGGSAATTPVTFENLIEEITLWRNDA